MPDLDPLPHYKPSPKQNLFHAADAKYRLLIGAWGSGKTIMAIAEDVMLAFEHPGSLGVVYRKTYPALRDTTKRDYIDALNPEIVKDIVRTEGKEQVEFINGSRTLFRCLDDFRKLGSTQFDRITIDEAWEISEDDFRMLAFGRLRGKIGPRKMVIASNPPNRDSWMYKFFVKEQQDDTAVFHFTTYDNAENLPADYIKRLESMPAQWKRKFVEGEWGVLVSGNPVFEDFRTDLHCTDGAYLPGVPVVRGWDFGFYHPACVWLQVAPSGHVMVLSEMLGENVDLYAFGQRVMNLSQSRFPFATFEDYCDVAGVQKNDKGPTSISILRQHFNLTPRFRKIGINQSIERIRYLLKTLAGGTPLLRLNREGCPLLADALSGGYVMDQEKDEPKKDGYYDNMVDALRYGLAPVLLPTVKPLTKVLGSGNWRPSRSLSMG